VVREINGMLSRKPILLESYSPKERNDSKELMEQFSLMKELYKTNFFK